MFSWHGSGTSLKVVCGSKNLSIVKKEFFDQYKSIAVEIFICPVFFENFMEDRQEKKNVALVGVASEVKSRVESQAK